jgi:exopolysaccharide production protein ExoQ
MAANPFGRIQHASTPTSAGAHLPRARLRSRERVVLDRLLRRFETLFLVVSVMMLAGAGAPLFRTGSLSGEEGEDPITRTVLAAAFLMAAIHSVVNFRAVATALRRNPWPALLVVLAITSTAWSQDPAYTFRRGVLLVGTTLIGVQLAVRYSTRETLKIVCVALGVMALLSLVVTIAAPSIGSPDGKHLGAWRGIFAQKNQFGRIMTLGVASFAVLAYGWRGRRIVAAAGGVLCGFLVAASTSRTAMLVAGVILLSLPLLLLLRKSRFLLPLALSALVISGFAGMYSAARSEEFFSTLDRDATMTGRTHLWEVSLPLVQDRPWFGYGFNAFWLRSTETGWAMVKAVRWTPPHSHNGFLDLMLELGIVALVLFLVGYVVALRRATFALANGEGAESLWPMVFLAFLLLYNFTEHTLLRQGSIFWALYTAVALGLPVPQRRRDGERLPRHRRSSGTSFGVRHRLRNDGSPGTWQAGDSAFPRDTRRAAAAASSSRRRVIEPDDEP